MPNEYLQTRAEESVSEYCKRNSVSAAFNREVARLLLSLRPTDRVNLIEAINQAQREDASDGIYARKDLLRQLDSADEASIRARENLEVGDG